MSAIFDRCLGRWRDLLMMMGIDRKHLTGQHTSCPLCGGKDRFRYDNEGGKGTWYCNSCGAGNGMTLIMKKKGWGFKEAAEKLEEIVGKARIETVKQKIPQDRAMRDIRQLWEMRRPILPGDPVDLFMQSRGFRLSKYPSSLQMTEQAEHPYNKNRYPAMLARVDSVDGQLVQVHRTFLTKQGSKADVNRPRLVMPGELPPGAAVRIGRPAKEMGIAEGIESAIAAALIFKFPVWAALTAGQMQKWVPPPECRKLHIFGDNDRTFTGHAHAYALASKIVVSERHDNVEVVVHFPPLIGDDMNDFYHLWKKDPETWLTRI